MSTADVTPEMRLSTYRRSVILHAAATAAYEKAEVVREMADDFDDRNRDRMPYIDIDVLGEVGLKADCNVCDYHSEYVSPEGGDPEAFRAWEDEQALHRCWREGLTSEV